MFHQQIVDDDPQFRGMEGFFLTGYIPPGHDGLNNRHIGRGTADTELFQGFDEGGFGKGCRRLGKMLLGIEFLQSQRFPFGHFGQGVVFVFALI